MQTEVGLPIFFFCSTVARSAELRPDQRRADEQTTTRNEYPHMLFPRLDTPQTRGHERPPNISCIQLRGEAAAASRGRRGKISLSRWWCCRRRRGGIFVVVCGPAMAVISFPPHAFSSGFHFIHDDDLLLLSLRAPSPLTWRPPHGKKYFRYFPHRSFPSPLLLLRVSSPSGLLLCCAPLRSVPLPSSRQQSNVSRRRRRRGNRRRCRGRLRR
jgi:hypothetical protein